MNLPLHLTLDKAFQQKYPENFYRKSEDEKNEISVKFLRYIHQENPGYLENNLWLYPRLAVLDSETFEFGNHLYDLIYDLIFRLKDWKDVDEDLVSFDVNPLEIRKRYNDLYSQYLRGNDN